MDLDLPFHIALIFFILTSVRIAEALSPGPRLRRRGPRSLDSYAADRNRCEILTMEAPESNDASSQNCLTMLHINLRGYLSHITATLRCCVEWK